MMGGSRILPALLLALGVGVALLAAYAAETPPADTSPKAAAKPEEPDFAVFRIVVDRNIFNSKRTATSLQEAGAATQAAPKPQVLRLMGAYLDTAKAIALFEGTDEVPGGGVNQGDSIAGYRVEEVRVDAVLLANDDGRIELPIGAGLSKDSDGHWTVVEQADLPHDAPAATATESTASDTDGAAAGSTDPNDPVEKLRARRRKELGQ